MLLRPLAALGLLNTALGTPLKRFDGLSISIFGPRSVSSINELELTATVTNNGAETVKILKYGTILDDKLPTRSFTVTKDGQPIAFAGIKLSLSLNHVDDSAYAVIPPGGNVTVNHEVASLFDFSAAGSGKFTFEPTTSFPIADSAERKVTSADDLSELKVTAGAIEVEVTGDVSNRQPPTLDERATIGCATSTLKSFINSSYIEAKSLARIASSYITSHGSSDPLFQAYYGANTPSSIASVYNAIANENSSTPVLNCDDALDFCSPGIIAYTIPLNSYIYFCSIFFNEVDTAQLCNGTTVESRNIRGGTTLHEFTHALAATRDIQYGCTADQSLSDSNQLINADNFNCFATQVYADTQC